MNGYNGEVLFVDLTSGVIKKESLPEKTYRDFIGGQGLRPYDVLSGVNGGFSMDTYREHILFALDSGTAFFSAIEALVEDCRLDRVWRFVTLVFMQHEGEVVLSRYGQDLLVERVES